MTAIHPVRILSRHTSLVATIVMVAVCTAQPAGAFTSTTRLAPRAAALRAEASPADDARLITKLDGGFEAIESLVDQRRSGVPFAAHELEILDAWQDGLPVAQIEALVLISRSLYNVYVAGTPADSATDDLLGRWRTYVTENAVAMQARGLRLNDDVKQDVQPPDGSRDWQLYWDPALYNQLSSAYQRNLERRYGRRGKVVRSVKGGIGAGDEGGDSTSPLAPPPNTLVNNPAADATTQDTQSETTLVLGSGSNILASFNDSGSDIAPNASFTGIARSTNGGTSFTDQGRLPVSANSDAGDPVYARNNTTGRIILATLSFNSAAALQSYRTDDDGATYQAPIDCDGGGTNNDKEWITCDNFAGAGQGNFYNFYRDFGGGGGMSFVRTTDGGATWGARVLLASGSGQGAWVTVGANHTVYAFWLASPNAIVLRRSTDQGVTFSAQVTAQTLRTTGTNGDLALNGGMRSNAFPQVVASPTDANQLYMVWNDKGISPSTDKSNVYFSQTTDGGTTWSPAVQVNTDAGLQDNWQPVIAITPDGTGLFVSWYDRRLDGANSRINVFGRNATISGSTVTFGTDYRITDADFPVVIGQDGVIVATYMGDYDQAVADNTSYYRTWGDNRLASTAHTTQPDVRFTKIPKAGPGAALTAGAIALTAENCTPANSAPDPGEVVTVNLTVANNGTAATVNCVGTLQVSGGVTSPSAPQNYGVIPVGGSVVRPFTFTVSGSCGGQVIASLQLQDGASNEGTVSYAPLTIGTTNTVSFSNPAAITIVDNAAGSPYPSNITVSGITSFSRVTVSLTGLSHTFPDDIDIILVAPGGAQKAYVMSDNGSGTDIVGVNLTFDDNAAAALSTATITSGTYKPSNLDTTTDVLPAPAPAGPYATSFATFNGLGAGANGTWSLYVRDDVGTDSGSISGGWSISFLTPTCSSSCGGGNIPPVSNAGTDQNVNSCTNVMLNGSGSSDPDSGPNPLSFAWSQTAGPTVVINNPTSATPTFEAPNVATTAVLTFQLTVSDGAAMNSDTINVTANHVAGVHVDTVGLYTNAGNTFFLRNCNGPGPADVTTFFGPNALIPLRGDWDNNGTDTVGVYDPATGSFFLRNANTPGPADIAFTFGPANRLPIVGDWDGNGTVTVGIYDTATGTFFLRNSNTPGAADLTFTFGAGGATPLAGDWDGNGSTTIGIYIEASGVFFLRNTNTPGGADVIFSYGPGTGFKPLTGNWDGIAGDTIGIFAPATGACFLRNTNSSGGADIIFTFGVGGAVTGIAGNWDGF